MTKPAVSAQMTGGFVFCCIGDTINTKFHTSSKLLHVAVQAGLSRAWSETSNTGFLDATHCGFVFVFFHPTVLHKILKGDSNPDD